MAENGFRNLLWFMAVVEDRRDPQKMGRVRVRCFDIHPDSKDEVPTEDLPWAIPVIGSYNIDYKPPLEGSWVFGFFLDGNDAQHPMLLGVMPGMPTTYANPQDGFNGASDILPKAADAFQPDMYKQARGEDIQDTVNVLRKHNLREKFPGYDFEEPITPFNPVYPHNKVLASESGHVVEIDDTPGSERVNVEHTSGTFLEMGPNGSEVHKIKGDSYTIIEKNGVLFIKGKADIVVQGSANVTIENNCTLNVVGDMKTNVNGDYRLNVAGGIYMNSTDIFSQRSSSIRQEAFLDSIHQYAKVNHTVEAKNNISLHANTGTMNSYSKGAMSHDTGSDYNIYASGSKHDKVLGSYNQAITGSTSVSSGGNYEWDLASRYTQTIDGDAYIRYDGDRSIHIGADTYSRHDAGIDYSWSSDPVRTTGQDGTTVPSASLATNSAAALDATLSLRTYLAEPPARRFPIEILFETEPYKVYTDPEEQNQDQHSIEDII